MAREIANLVDQAARRIEQAATPEKAKGMAAYMKNQFEFFGTQAGPRRTAQRPIVNELKSADAHQLLAFAQACWRHPKREMQYLGADTLRKYASTLTQADIPAVKALITDKSWWDTVDLLAAYVIGPIVLADRQSPTPTLGDLMDQWVTDDDIWVARTAILHQLSYKHHTHPQRLFRYAELRAADTEFFIRKALGWALRQYARCAPDEVEAFVRSHELSGLTKREALRHITAKTTQSGHRA